MSCLGIIFSLYGFDSLEQQEGFVDLLNLSETSIPSQYVTDICTRYMEYETHNWLIEVTQNKFYAKQKGERWEQKIPEWINKNANVVVEDSKRMGFLSKIYPKQNKFECAAIFGSTAPNMQLRIEDFKYRVENDEIKVDKVFLLTGERYAASKVDGGEKYIKKIAKKYKVKDSEVTETMLMEDLYHALSSNTKVLKDIPVKVIDTPRGDKARPNTIDTLYQFLRGLQSNECKTIIYISKAPYTLAQGEDTKKIMYILSPQRKFEVIGDGVGVEIKQIPIESAAYHGSMALAGQLYSGFEMVTKQINSKYNMCSSIEYLSNYKQAYFSKIHKTASNKKVELPNTKIN